MVPLLTHFSFILVMLRGIGPGDSRYDRGDIIQHIDGILCLNAKQTLLSDMLETERDDRDDGSKWDKNTIFSNYVPDNFIRSRSLILGGLMDGLSLNGRRNVSESLERGSELSNILRYVPLDAVTKILFARPVLNFDDVKEAMLPGMHSTLVCLKFSPMHQWLIIQCFITSLWQAAR